MSKPVIHTRTKKYAQYARIVYQRVEAGKRFVTTEKLGRVIDLGVINLGEGIFKNRIRVVFHFDFETGFTEIEPSAIKPGYKPGNITQGDIETNELNNEPNDNLNNLNNLNEHNERGMIFGHIYVVNELLRKLKFMSPFKNIYPNHPDSLLTLILFRLLTDEPYENAYQWWENSSAKL